MLSNYLLQNVIRRLQRIASPQLRQRGRKSLYIGTITLILRLQTPRTRQRPTSIASWPVILMSQMYRLSQASLSYRTWTQQLDSRQEHSNTLLTRLRLASYRLNFLRRYLRDRLLFVQQLKSILLTQESSLFDLLTTLTCLIRSLLVYYPNTIRQSTKSNYSQVLNHLRDLYTYYQSQSQ